MGSKLKPHLLPKTGQKLVFLRKKKVKKNYETVKTCDLMIDKIMKLEKV